MWCPAAGCGWNGSGKFCPDCGTKTVAELPDLVVICDGKTEDGSACRAEITAGQKFCINCGKKVDLGLFGSLGDLCLGCGYPLMPSCVFCPECGKKKGSQPTAAQSTDHTETSCKDISALAEGDCKQQKSLDVSDISASAPEQLVTADVKVEQTKAPEHLVTADVKEVQTKAPEHLVTAGVKVEQTKAPEHLVTAGVKVEQTKAPEHLVTADVTVEQAKAPEHLVTAGVKVEQTKAPEHLVTADVKVEPTKAPEHLVTADVTVEQAKAPEHLVTAGVKVEQTKAPEHLVTADVTVEQAKAPEHLVTAGVKVEQTKAPEHLVTADVKVEPTKAPEHLVTAVVKVEPTKAPEHLVTAVVKVEPTKAPEHLVTADVKVEQAKAPEHLVTADVTVEQAKAPEHLVTAGVKVVQTKAPEHLVTADVTVEQTKAPEHLVTANVKQAKIETSELALVQQKAAVVEESNTDNATKPLEVVDATETETLSHTDQSNENNPTGTNQTLQRKGNLMIFVEDSASGTVQKLNSGEGDDKISHTDRQGTENSKSCASNMLSEKFTSVHIGSKGNVSNFTDEDSNNSALLQEQSEQENITESGHLVALSNETSNSECDKNMKLDKLKITKEGSAVDAEEKHGVKAEETIKSKNEKSNNDQSEHNETLIEHSDGSVYGTADENSSCSEFEDSFEASTKIDLENSSKTAESLCVEKTTPKRKKASTGNNRRVKRVKHSSAKSVELSGCSSKGAHGEIDPSLKDADEQNLKIVESQQHTENIKEPNAECKTNDKMPTPKHKLDTNEDGNKNEDQSDRNSGTNESVFGAAKTWTKPLESDQENTFGPYSSLFGIKTNVEDEKQALGGNIVANEKTDKPVSDEEKSVQRKLEKDENDDSDSSGESEENMSDKDGKQEKDELGTDVDKHLSKRQRKNQKKRAQRERKLLRENQTEETNTGKGAGDQMSGTGPGVQTRSITLKKNERQIILHFHVLVSEEFKFDPEKDRVILRVGTTDGWNSNERVMELVSVPEKPVELEYKLKLPASVLMGDGRIEYKYMVSIHDKEKMYWEHYLKNGSHGVDVNRVFRLQNKFRKLDVWHQYDGVLEKEPTSLAGKFSELVFWKKGLRKHLNVAIETFCKSMFQTDGPNYSMHDAQLLPEMLLIGVRKVYYIDANCWDTETEFVKEVVAPVISTLLEQIELQAASESQQQSEQRLSIAFAVLHLIKTFPLDPVKNDRRLLTKALLMKTTPESAEKQECPEMQIVKKMFPERSKELLERFQSITKRIAHTWKDPSWLYFMPWIHFLSETCQPYEKASVDLKHDATVPRWWGTVGVQEAIKYFKENTKSWSISVEDVLRELYPIFEMDYYLARTFVAALDRKDLLPVIQSEKIPLEVAIASVIYHIKATRPTSYYSSYSGYSFPHNLSSGETVVQDCVKSLLSQLQKTFYSEECTAVQWSTIHSFAAQLLEESTKTNRHQTLAYCAQLLVHCLSMYDRVIMEDKSEQEKTTDHFKKMHDSIQTLMRWMDRWHYNVDIHTHMDQALQGLDFDSTKPNVRGFIPAAVSLWSDTFRDVYQLSKVWNSLFAPTEIQSERVRDEWNKSVASEMSKKLDYNICKTNQIMTNFVTLYCQKVETYCTHMAECLSKVAFKAIAEGYSLDYRKFSDVENRIFGRLLSELFITEWNKSMKANRRPEDVAILNHILQWPPFLQYLRIYYADETRMKLLSEDCLVHLVQAVSVIVKRTEALLNGSIIIGELDMIVAQGDKFAELAVFAEERHSKQDITTAISCRVQDMHSFRALAEQVVVLTNLCQHTGGVDTRSVDEVLDKQKDIEKYQVREFCTPVALKDDVYTPQVHAFHLSAAVFVTLPKLYACYPSSTFMTIWYNQCKATTSHTLEDVIQNVWLPVKQKWDTWALQISAGSIKFRDFEKLFGQAYQEDLNVMKVELKAMKVKEMVINRRLEQLTKYRQLEACVKGATVILKFVREYKLTGNFDPIQDIANYHQKDFPMGLFDDSLMQTCAFLKDLKRGRAHCLYTFVKCEPLITWLKTSMKKSGLKELKVFVDLAFMSAGDDTMNIARVQCLHSAVTGYAPLIFDLQQTADYKDLLQICDVVWKELDANTHLPQQLKDTTAHLEWLKEIEKAHGSVEVTSLVQSDAINCAGVYTVGRRAQQQTRDNTLLEINSEKLFSCTRAERHSRLQKKLPNTIYSIALRTIYQLLSKTLMDKPKQDPKECLRLMVSEAEEAGKRQRRNYTYTQLQDLQSRLMLVAGRAEKGNDGVEMFTMIYDSVKRLANVYMRLCCSGCVLFRDWTATFLCDTSRPVCTILEFGQGEDSSMLKGRRNQREDLREMIPRLASFMEYCHEQWLEYIKRKRGQYVNLNYFTVDQLVILQREIVKLGTAEQPSHLIYPLLSAVKADCSTEDLMEAMTAAQLDKEQMENVAEGEDGEGDDDMDPVEDEGEVKQRLIQELVDSGYDRRLAQRAVEHVGVGPEAETEGILWCISHEADIEEETHINEVPGRTSLHGKDEFAFQGWSQSVASILSVIKSKVSELHASSSDTGVEPLLKQLRSLWEKFLGSISSNIQDYLSLEHLGMILGHLAQKDGQQIKRGLPPGFEEGSPNLIICPSGDVLTTALSIYMLDRYQPFPQPDEVLMCTAHTTIDEVDIFWRRAIFDGGRKIHCLLEADLLDFNVSEAAERCLEEYIQETNHSEPKYRLIVICGMDNEYRSRIVASLDKHRRPGLPINHQSLRNYIATKLQIRDTVHGVNPAAIVDDNRSSARLVKSSRAGVGKTLYKQRREQALTEMSADEMSCVSLPLQEKYINLHYFIQRLLEHTAPQNQPRARIFHIDIAHEVEEGVDYLLFNLLVLGCLMDRSGYVWRKLPTDLYLIETMPLMMATQRGGDMQYVHQMLSILPDMTCRSPQESLDVYGGARPPGYMAGDQLFDKDQFESPVFQRPFQYLLRLDQGRQLDDIEPYEPEGDYGSCLHTLLRHCGVQDPSWAELHHFVWFLNTQLQGFEQNSFVSHAAAEDLPGFGKFVLRFLIQMSRDFSTRSLNMSEESPGVPRMVDEEDENNGGNDLEQYQMRRTWESSPHPYLFFNQDKFTFTFLGFYIDRASGNLIDQQTGVVLERGIMAQNLYDSLVRNHAPMQENFDTLPRHEKIRKLCSVMGNELPYDPDDSYELTTDNVKKMMAIYMRFRCDIPVIIMGETGCGKTTLVKFMCALQIPPGLSVTNMILMKVHGGTTTADIKRKVEEAERAAQQNIQAYGEQMYTVLFFDEANTTEAIGLIKEIMCDKSMEGRKLKLCKNLKMVAACNPYRKHSDELIRKLEQAGLGYHVDADETTDKLGRVPMRRLVYRVQPLPQSLLPLVWDFGQLNTNVEDLYIRQMVRRYVRADELPDIQGLVEVVSAILTASQDYMRKQQDECSFVSLRDVDRVLRVMSWFYDQSEGERTLYRLMDKKMYGDQYSDDEDDADNEDNDGGDERQKSTDNAQDGRLEDVTRSLVLALGVCYHACLKDRPQYRTYIARHFRAPCQLFEGGDQIEREISCCQEVFLDNVQLEKNIARNMALKENIFMMVVCIELRLPLFLVGKPGSSKSLAKTIVSDAMQGNASREILFKELKQAQMVSFQCSPLSTPDGIVGTFRQCAQFQKDKDLNNFVSIVVLDEVGLAEDSPRMPLKTLHPLLEDGCQGDEKPEAFMKVAFVGISNWALDPAKMNRGILVQREVPDLEELKNSALGICDTTHKVVKNRMQPLITPMAESYLEIFEKASTRMREFYGLRDFYSLVKMVYSFSEKSKQRPTWYEMVHSIKRNFGGLDQVDPVEFFEKHLARSIQLDDQPRPGDPDCSAAGLIQACLVNTESESRYLLLLTENYGALTILQQQILSSDIRPITIFGSSFRSDQEYTQVCRNINKIKVCMETGNTVVLLNLENLYESLYDALNQYYVYFGGERYVDLGLGTHRVKCPVHRNFRLIVVAEKQTVYKKFPIPLINRLEKHFLTINTMLSAEQLEVVKRLADWAKQFVSQTGHRGHSSKVGDAFMGYHDDTCSAIVLHVWPKPGQEDIDQDQLLQEAKAILLWCATPAAVVRVEQSSLPPQEKTTLQHQYHEHQRHGSIAEYLHFKLVEEGCKQLYAQVTTHSKLLVAGHRRELAQATGITPDKILLLDTLSSFDTEQQFSNKIQQHMQRELMSPSLLVIQCDSGDINANLVACARYCVMDEYLKVGAALRASVHIVFIVQLPNITGGCFTGFQCGIWHSAHIDDLWTTDVDLPSIQEMQTKSVSRLVSDAVQTAVPMETEEGHAGEERGVAWEGMERDHRTRPADAMYGEEPVPHEGDPYKAAIDLEDVMRNAGMPVDRHSAAGGRRYLNVQKLILSCVQAALSMLKDKEESSARTTDRVALLLKLFHHDSRIGKQFLHGVSQLIANLLEEKEGSSYRPQQWLLNETARQENIQKAGTFRQACIQTLESKISPILAGIIAHLDTNQNLDILQQQLPWKQNIWLAILNAAGILQLQYSDLQSPKRLSDLKEVVVTTTGCEGHVFKSQMPFSWLIFQQINNVIKNPQPDHEDERSVGETVEFFVNVLVETSLGKLLWEIRDHTLVEYILQAYLGDFVHFVYLVQSDQELTLVCQTIEYKASLEPTEGSLLHRLVTFHMAHQKLAPCLTYFRAMNSVWPECSSAIITLKQENPDHYMFKEEEFTFSALCLLIEYLSPQLRDLDQPQGRTSWLARVHQMRPVIEKVLNLYVEDPKRYGAHSSRSVLRARCLWTRVVVVKLFLEHVCATEQEDKITIKYCMPLWKLLGEEANMKEVATFKCVERFLKGCNKMAIKAFLGKEEKCVQCESLLDGPPSVLPCTEVLCDRCFQDMLVAHGDTKCPKCKTPVPNGWNPERQTVKNDERQKLKNYQKRCNSFFMDLVSQLCFADNTPPSEDVVNQLLGYITCSTINAQRLTREISVFETGVDPNPVFRSFLLQLLMKTCEEHVAVNLGKYLDHAHHFFDRDQGKQKEFTQLCLLVIQCLEDIYSQHANKSDVDELSYATTCLQDAMRTINVEQISVEKLTGLAEVRAGLAIVARCLFDVVRGRTADVKVRRLLEAAQALCQDGGSKWPRVYLVKVMCRRYGTDLYRTVCQSDAYYLTWINMRYRKTQQQVEGADRYIICGEPYTRIREAVTKVVLGEEIQVLDRTLQDLRSAGGHGEVMLQLALHKEITCSNLYIAQQKRVSDNVLAVMDKYVKGSKTVKNKELAQTLIHNAVSRRCPRLLVRPNEDLLLQGIQGLLTHFLCAISQLKGDRTLLQPLIMLVRNPQLLMNSFLPTMPQDDVEDVKEALLKARNSVRGADANPVFYRCPNGHPYVVGDCGRPVLVAKCRCGADIGGQGHTLLTTNALDTGVDTTQTGHILGRAEARVRGPYNERALNPSYCACVRLLMHMAMYLGAANDPQATVGLIKPNIRVEDVSEFLWQHIHRDIEDVQRAIGRSVDDVLVLVHVIINQTMKLHNPASRFLTEVHKLTSKRGRFDWEQKFSNAYLVPIMQTLDSILKEANQQLAQDNRLGADLLLCLLYEVDDQTEGAAVGPLQDVAEVWRYRTPVSLSHLRHEFDAQVADQKGKPQHPVLQQFLKEDHHLRAIRHIPSILRLHRALFFKYQRKLDKAEASNITVSQLKREEIAGEETRALIEDFTEAWELVREDLKLYMCPTEVGGMIVSMEYCNKPITDKTPISLLLPTTKEAGLCSLAMMDFLMRKQNDFLDGYQKVTKRKLDSVPAREVTSAHLISYDPQHDILPLVLANCQYSFEMGKGTKIEYDFAGLERQLMDRFLFSKSRIDVGRVLQIDQMIYRTEFTSAVVFKSLTEKIPQVGLNSAVKSQILSEIRSLPELCQSLDNLDISISFLKSIGGDPQHSLADFMENTLKMEISLYSHKAKQICQFQHTQSLWMLLSLQKSKLQAEYKQPRMSIFESVTREFMEDLPEDVTAEFVAYMKKLSVEKLTQLVEVLHEYIILVVAVRENKDDEDYIDTTNQKLREWLCVYVESQDQAGIDTQVLQEMPLTILYKHSVDTWVSAYRTLQEKRTGQRRF